MLIPTKDSFLSDTFWVSFLYNQVKTNQKKMSAGTKRNSGGDDDAANDDATIGE